MIYRFRVVLDNDTKEDIFRDIEIRKTDSLEDLHNVITQSFGFDGSEMASFYLSDDNWNQGEEISLFDMSEGGSDIQLMNEKSIDKTVSESSTKLIYVYDFLNMWTFLVELAEVVQEAQGTDYPNLMYVHGQVPNQAPEKTFKAEQNEDGLDEYRDDYNSEDYDQLDYNDNWD
ncbi:plasmid pRiA4b ORF-3 family protein [Flavobacteriaceae bacterium]|nr:plasmid pRiA4b ORF-3 family protein [Flavobacteriaceae bacterium]